MTEPLASNSLPFRIRFGILLTLAVSFVPVVVISAEKPRLQSEGGVVFRKPFTLKLHVDKSHYYEQDFNNVPYVKQGELYLFKGDAFGINLHVTNGVLRGISYQADLRKAAVSFRFKEEVDGHEETMMVLMIDNHTRNKLFVDGFMTLPKGGNPQETSILPLGPGVSGYKTWPHAIVQLVLRNLRFTIDAKAEPAAR
jgi:hypothetical protein